MLTRDLFENMDEATLCAEVIIPLLEKLGYKDVREYHGGATELGKDIVCWKNDELGVRINLAIVAKAVRMNGKAKADVGTAGEVQTQVRQCFGSSYQDSVAGTEQKVDAVWVVNNHEISKESIAAISSALGAAELRTVRFIGNDNLWKLVEQYLPVSILQYAQELQKHIGTADPDFKHRIVVGNDEIGITLEEKYPGAAQKPLKTKGQFVFPTKADKTKFDKAFQHHIETGEAFDVPPEYIGKIDFPDAIQSVIGVQSFQPQGVRIQSAFTSKVLPVQIAFHCEDGEKFICHFIRLVVTRAGTKELMLVGNQKDAPFDIEIVMRHSDKQANIATSPWTEPYNAVQWLSFLKMRNCLSKPVSIEFFSLDLGVKVLSVSSQGDNEAPPSDHIDFIEKLAVIQKKFMIPLYIPERDFTDEEVQTIEALYDGITTGRSEAEWLPFKQIIQPTKEDLDAIIETFDNNNLGFFSIESNKVTELLGVKIPVGHVREVAHNAKLNNIEDLRSRYDDLLTAENLELEFVPADGAIVVTEYIKWLPKSERENVQSQLDNE